MLYSRTSEYAIRVLAFLSGRKPAEPVTLEQVHAASHVPPAYAAKIFQCLVLAGIAGSKSGPRGGYFLKADPRRLRLLDVIRAVDEPGESVLFNCVMGRSECSDRRPCCLHAEWAKSRARLLKALEHQSVADAYAESRAVFYRRSLKTNRLSKRMRHVFGQPRSKRGKA